MKPDGPLPLLSRDSLRVVLTMNGRLPLIRIDAEGNPRMGWVGYLVCALSAALVVGVGWWILTMPA